jgi:predicted alpha/beta superfamily hydrolase
VIIAGIWNTGAYRFAGYFPQEPLSYLPAEHRDTLVHQELLNGPLADNYLRFLTQELKPYIDSTFSTLPDKANTFFAGSSIGGLISLYALCEYPDVFGGATCLSMHWPGSLVQQNDLIPLAFNRYISKKLPSPLSHKIYFDHGTRALDSLYKPWQLLINRTMKAKGYTGKSMISREFTGEGHTETAWAKRLHIPLLFLLHGNVN